jgi:flagellar basal body-associated protein FliL
MTDTTTAGTPGADQGAKGAPMQRKGRRRAIIMVAAVLVLLGAAGGGWYVWHHVLFPASGGEEATDAKFLPLPPPNAVYVKVPVIQESLAGNENHMVRLNLMLEAAPGRGRPLLEGESERMTIEVRHWLRSQRLADVTGAVGIWTIRARCLAIARTLFPELGVQDVLIQNISVQ